MTTTDTVSPACKELRGDGQQAGAVAALLALRAAYATQAEAVFFGDQILDSQENSQDEELLLHAHHRHRHLGETKNRSDSQSCEKQ